MRPAQCCMQGCLAFSRWRKPCQQCLDLDISSKHDHTTAAWLCSCEPGDRHWLKPVPDQHLPHALHEMIASHHSDRADLQLQLRQLHLLCHSLLENLLLRVLLRCLQTVCVRS